MLGLCFFVLGCSCDTGDDDQGEYNEIEDAIEQYTGRLSYYLVNEMLASFCIHVHIHYSKPRAKNQNSAVLWSR